MKFSIVMFAVFSVLLGLNAQILETNKKISAKEAQKMMDSQEVVILDVRTREEYNGGHIPNAVLLPLSDILVDSDRILPDKDAVILVYCRSGARSANAARELQSMGYKKIYDFGGIIDWKGEIVK